MHDRRLACAALTGGAYALSCAYALRDGLRYAGDTPGYLEAGRLLMQGEWPTWRPGYHGYEAIVGLTLASGLGQAGVVAIQIVAGALATFALYRLGGRLGGSLAGCVAALIGAANIDVIRWHAFVLSNSLYASFVPITAWTLHEAAEGRRGFAPWALVSLLVVATCRPEGGALALGLAGYAALRSRARVRLMMILGAAVLAALLAPSPGRGLDAAFGATRLARGEVIGNYEHWRVLADDPLSYAVLAAARLAVEFSHVRPYYSLHTNVVMPAILVALYAFAVLGYRRARDRWLARLLATIVVVHAAVVALTFADSDSRFLIHAMGPISALAACGISVLARGRGRVARREGA